MVIVNYVMAFVIGGFLIFFGWTKFTGAAHIFPYIEYKATALGLPLADLFFPLANNLTGLLEIVAGVLLILPMTRKVGAYVAVVPFLGAVAFHVSPLLGVSTPGGYATPPPAESLAAGGPFLREDFSTALSPVLFVMAAAMLFLAVINALVVQRRR